MVESPSVAVFAPVTPNSSFNSLPQPSCQIWAQAQICQPADRLR
jgi:hypothetical protein